MDCTAPYWIEGQRVPCGNCLECRQARANEWTIRILHEAEYHDKATFLTLTYEDNELPQHGGLEKQDWVDFIKKLRKNTGRHYTYYAIGEYGTEYGRPHMHAILFGAQPCGKCIQCTKDKRYVLLDPERETDCHDIKRTWGKGNVQLGYIEMRSIRYVVNYINKSYGEKPLGGRQLPFALMSKGIGKKWLQDHRHQVETDQGIRFAGKTHKMPRYYRKNLSEEPSRHARIYGWFLRQESITLAKKERKEGIEEFNKRHRQGTINTGPHLMGQAMRQRHRNNVAKDKNTRRDIT